MRRSPAWLSLALTLVLALAAGCVELKQQVAGGDSGGAGPTDTVGGADTPAEDVPSGGEDAPAEEVAAAEVAGGDVTCPGEPPDCNALGVCVTLGDEVVPDCEGGTWVCPTDGVPDYEPVEASCDGLDNDCDGATDEGLGARTDAATLAEAGCRNGGPCAADVFAVCVAAEWVCGYDGVDGYETVEVSCDGVDNDCDGDTDQAAAGVALQEACASACGAGVRTCAGGAYGACSAPEPATEVCDGVDNNCDGATDEDLTEPPAEFTCPAEGVCGDAVDPPVSCVSTGENPGWACDFSGVEGWEDSETICDELDNDCDGATDEDIAEPDDVATIGCETAGVCAFGVTAACGAGGWDCDYSGVAGYEEGDEVSCDGLDNDCDSDTDEDIPDAADPQAVGCPEAVGVCATGDGVRAVCQDGDWACITRVPSEYEAGAEVTCDGKDNDCDGQTDEGIVATSGAALDDCLDLGACASGVVAVCLGGAFACVYTAEGFEPREVSCDGVDNDCDGATDTLPGGGPLQVSPAEAGCKTDGVCDDPAVDVSCEDGGWRCDYTPIPTFEQTETLCDGLDNDCDASTDEDLADVVAAGCKLVGRCSAANVEAACTGAGGYTCDYAGVTGYEGDAETSCNGADDDCDGQTDEALGSDPATAGCDVTGQCTPANVDASCAGAAGWACDYSAVPEWQASEDRCDGLDNDCDGETDEDVNGDPLTDETSPTTTCPTDGVCAAGVPATCESGGWTCHFDQVPDYEGPEATCDTLDNNCDGTTDEDVCTGPGVPCDGPEGCASTECHTDIDGAGMFCALDADTCVLDLGATREQVADTESRCTAADTYSACAAGAWGAATTCAEETPFCLAAVDGACHLCQPGTTQCVGDDVGTCDPTGDAIVTAACEVGKVCAGDALCYPTNPATPTGDALGAADTPDVAWQEFGTAGYWIVAWAELGADGSQDVVFRRVNADASGQAAAVLTERPASAGSAPYSGDQIAPAVASYGGGFAVGWTSLDPAGDGDGSGVFLRRMVAGGFSGDAANMAVNTTTAGDQTGLRLADYAGTDSNGALVAVFSGPQGVAFRRFPLAANSAALDAAEQSVTAEATAAAPDVAAIPTGAFAVVWQQPVDVGVYDVLIRWFDTDGTALSDAVLVADDVGVGAATTAPLPRVAVLPDLGWLVVWTQDNGDQSGWEVQGQLYTSVETALGGAFPVASGTALVGDAPALDADPGSGRFVVVYTDDAIDGAGTGIAAVGVTPGDVPTLGGPVQVNASATGDQTSPAVTSGPAGAFVGVWETPDADQTGVVSRLLRIP